MIRMSPAASSSAFVTPVRAPATGRHGRTSGKASTPDGWRRAAHKFRARRGCNSPITVLNARRAPPEFYDSDAMTRHRVAHKDRFIVVTTHGGVRLSRNIRTLLDYIRNVRPKRRRQSDIVSIFRCPL